LGLYTGIRGLLQAQRSVTRGTLFSHNAKVREDADVYIWQVENLIYSISSLALLTFHDVQSLVCIYCIYSLFFDEENHHVLSSHHRRIHCPAFVGPMFVFFFVVEGNQAVTDVRA
jgi:hypothetical protein